MIDKIKTLEDSFQWLDSLGAKDSKDWLDLNEDEAMAVAHHGFGTMVRNTLGLWHDGSMVPFFNELGITHADDMSGIILTSYHRKKNNKDIDLDGQVKKYLDFWEKNK